MRILLVAAATLALSPVWADVQTFGELEGDVEDVRIGKLLNNPDAYVDKKIRIAGLVDDVCPRKGCWVDIIDAQSSDTIRFKVQDDVIVFPVAAKGEEIVAEGIFRRHEFTREQATKRLKHLAEEKGEAFDEASVTGPMVFYQVEGIGAAVGR